MHIAFIVLNMCLKEQKGLFTFVVGQTTIAVNVWHLETICYSLHYNFGSNFLGVLIYLPPRSKKY